MLHLKLDSLFRKRQQKWTYRSTKTITIRTLSMNINSIYKNIFMQKKDIYFKTCLLRQLGRRWYSRCRWFTAEPNVNYCGHLLRFKLCHFIELISYLYSLKIQNVNTFWTRAVGNGLHKIATKIHLSEEFFMLKLPEKTKSKSDNFCPVPLCVIGFHGIKDAERNFH